MSFATQSLDRLRRFSRRIWARTTLIALLAVISAVSGTLLGPFVPDDLALLIETAAVSRLLEILAASMLTVTTFSLSIMVAARQSASTQGTPRSLRLLLEDTTTQTVIATFLGAFVFALVSLILISAGVYADRSVVVVLGFTIVVVLLVVLAILRWIDHLSDLGGVAATADKLEDAAMEAIRERRRMPCLGGRPLSPSRREIPLEARSVAASTTGYVDFINPALLDDCAKAENSKVFVVAEIGCFVAAGDPLCLFTGQLNADRLRSAFSIGRSRKFDHDPRYGIIALAEIAQRALSPGVNDPGTAIDVIGRLVRLLLEFEDEARVRENVDLPHVWIVPVTSQDLISDSVHPIARDGAGVLEVQITLQKALARLVAHGDPAMAPAAEAESGHALELALKALPTEADQERLRSAVTTAFHSAASR